MSEPFRYIKAVGQTKEDVWNEDSEKEYMPFLTNRNFSLFPDTVLFAQAMNEMWHLPHHMQYVFYLNILRPASRYYGGKWPKREKNEALMTLIHDHKLGSRSAKQALQFLSEEQLQELADSRKDKGGVNDE